MATHYKIKTHKGVQKRVKVTGSKTKKKFLVDKSCNNHLLLKKQKNGTHKKSPYGKTLTVTQSRKISRLLPYA